MSRLVLLATVLAATLVAAQTASLTCQGTTMEQHGCMCSYVDNYARVSCPSLSALQDLPPLTHTLDISRTDVAELAGDLFAGLVALEELLLCWTRMANISERAFRNLTELRVLNLSHNLLSTLPPDLLDGVPRLQKLDLSFNRLSSLDVDTFRYVPSLDELYLSYNNHLGAFLQTSPEAMSVAFENDLRTLSLDHVGLAYVPDNFFVKADSLRELSLADNPLEMIPFLPGGLEMLDLSGSLLRELIPGSFLTLPFLRVLRLERMRELESVQENALEGLTSLDELWMAGCVNLREVSAGMFGELALQRCAVRRLSLARGGLQGLPEKLLGPLSALDYVDLQGNPWDCDCHLAWLRRLNLSADVTADLRCAAPAELRHSLVLSLPEPSFRCSVHKRRRVLAVAVVAGLMLAVAVVGASGLLLRRLLKTRRRDRGGAGGGLRAPGVYEMLHMSGHPADEDDDDVSVVWSTQTSAR